MNKTMTIIELLNKIANGEEVPKKIKINNIIYEYRGYMYCTEKANYQDIENYLFGKWNFNILNDTVEIIEDDDKLEKIKWNEKESRAGILRTDQEIEVLAKRTETLKKKIAELVDHINKIEERLDER